MPISDAENTDTDENKSSKQSKVNLKDMMDIKDLKIECVYEYIAFLHTLVKKQQNKLKKYKNKINKLMKEIDNRKDNEKKEHISANLQLKAPDSTTGYKIQTSDVEGSNETKQDDLIIAQEAFNFVDEMRQVAQHAQSINNFIYEPTSGLYYDQKTGYYYNAEYGLYYDGDTGCYYNYNQNKNCYEFHSQVGVQPTATSTKEDDNVADDDEVIFDEFGVVTNQEKLKRLREEREQKQKKERKFIKKISKDNGNNKEKKYKKSSYKHPKRSKKHATSSASDSEDEKSIKGICNVDYEDGELSTSSTTNGSESLSDSESEKRKVPLFKSCGRFQDVAKQYPPSLRIVIQETNLEDLKVGSLSLITFKGGSLGREGNHDVIIPDVNVSKFHLKFSYDTKKSVYKCVDLGSRNGTILNGSRMSASMAESNLYDLVHGSVIQISQTKLLCHIHEGNSTCGLCEPGLLIESQQRNIPSASAKVLSHREQLKKIQKKYGLENEKFFDSNTGNCIPGSVGNVTGKSTYHDRAATRRLKVGGSSDKEKTQTASVDTAISSNNKGFKMLAKLGWNKGEALGKNTSSCGLLEPISSESNIGHKGLGYDDYNAGFTLSFADKKKLESVKKTKERYLAANIIINTNDSN